METELKYTEDYCLLIDLDSKSIKQSDLIYDAKIDVIINYTSYKDGCFKIIAYKKLNPQAKDLDLPLLPKFEDNIEKLAKEFSNKGSWQCPVSFIEGYKEAQSKGTFTLEDMKKAIEMARKTFPTDKLSCDRYSTEEIIQTLSTQHLPKEFIPEYRYYYHSSKEFYSDAGFIECSKEQYESIKVEIPTCPLKVEIKTTINSEGKEEIQGTYKY